MTVQRLAIATLALVATGISACSSETNRSIDTASSTTDTSTTLVDTTVPATAGETTVPVTSAPVTAAPATNPPATQPPATNAPSGPGFYEQVPPPTAPSGHTDPFVSSGPLTDGYYWVQYNGGETMTPDITVMQAFFGAECESEAAAVGDECYNDIFVKGDPSRDLDDLAFADDVYLTVADQVLVGKSYFVTPDELRTIRSGSPSDGAPDDFSFAGFPWLMTVEGGVITQFEQLWVP